jgi:hypothetical protein
LRMPFLSRIVVMVAVVTSPSAASTSADIIESPQSQSGAPEYA